MLQGNDQGYLRITLGVCIVVLAAGMLFGVWGYTSAQVGNEANLTIVDSANALVAVNIPLSEVHTSSGSPVDCGTITNNKSEDIEITVTTVPGDLIYTSLLSPGDFTYLTVPSNKPVGTYDYSGTVTAVWPGGQAEINFDVWVIVE